jgi:hypothetical protein
MFELLPVCLGTDAGFWKLSPFLRATILTGTLEVALPEVSILSDPGKKPLTFSLIIVQRRQAPILRTSLASFLAAGDKGFDRPPRLSRELCVCTSSWSCCPGAG